MIEFLLAFVFLALVMSAMSIGVIFANKPIKGSCGGMSALGFNTECEICGGDRNKCEKEAIKPSDLGGYKQHTDLAYDASNKSR